jgi:uncharacterized protein (DUF433 family)
MEPDKQYNGLIRADPNIMMGKPVVAGTRITVEHIVEDCGRRND